MSSAIHSQFIFFYIVNIIFTFTGIVLNTLVIVSIWKSSQLRKKLCHFMIMVLSCFDLLTVVTNYLGIMLFLNFWLREDYDLLLMVGKYLDLVSIFRGFSFHVLLVISIERYIGVFSGTPERGGAQGGPRSPCPFSRGGGRGGGKSALL